MSEQPWFKVWAQPVLGSLDLSNLSDHEERVWWRLLCVAASESERGRITTPLPVLARHCASTPVKAKQALNRFQQLGMLTKDDDGWLLVNWEKYQETPDARRKRLQRERDRKRDMSRDESRQEGKKLEPSVSKETSGAARKPRRPKKTLTPEFLERMQTEEPTLDIPAFAEDYLNWAGSDDHKNLESGFRNQLRIEWKRKQFTRDRQPVPFREPVSFKPPTVAELQARDYQDAPPPPRAR